MHALFTLPSSIFWLLFTSCASKTSSNCSMSPCKSPCCNSDYNPCTKPESLNTCFVPSQSLHCFSHCVFCVLCGAHLKFGTAGNDFNHKFVPGGDPMRTLFFGLAEQCFIIASLCFFASCTTPSTFLVLHTKIKNWDPSTGCNPKLGKNIEFSNREISKLTLSNWPLQRMSHAIGQQATRENHFHQWPVMKGAF